MNYLIKYVYTKDLGLNGIIPDQAVDINFKMFADNKITWIAILNNLQTSALLLVFIQNSI